MILRLTSLALFLVATTYVAGHALSWLPSRFRFPNSALLRSACGLALSFLACLLPWALARWLVLALVLSGIAAVLLRRGGLSPRRPRLASLAALLPGIVVACLALGYGPWGDARWSDDGGLLYRTGATVGSRSAGPSGALSDSALVAAIRNGTGDPFVSELTLPAADARRTYMGLAHWVTGLDLLQLTVYVFPSFWILGVMAVGARLARTSGPLASTAFGCLLFASGFSFAAGLLPLIRSWQYRIWPFLTESTGMPSLLASGETACLLLLVLAGLACTTPEPDAEGEAAIGGLVLLWIGASAVEPAVLLPLGAGVLVYQCFQPRRIGLTALGIATLVGGLFLSQVVFEPLHPMLRALEYSRLEVLHDAALEALSSGRLPSVARTLTCLPVFLVLSLGLRVWALPQLVAALRSPRPHESAMAATIASFLGLGLIARVPSDSDVGTLYWSLGLLLLWVYVSERTARLLSGRSIGRRVLLAAGLLVLAFPSTVNYLVHYRSAAVQRVAPSDVELARRLQSASEAGDVVLHPPNRRTLSLSAHVAHRPTVLCYFGREGTYPAETLEERSRDVIALFATPDPAGAFATVARYRARFVLEDRRHPLPFEAPPWLERVEDGEDYTLYRVR